MFSNTFCYNDTDFYSQHDRQNCNDKNVWFVLLSSKVVSTSNKPFTTKRLLCVECDLLRHLMLVQESTTSITVTSQWVQWLLKSPASRFKETPKLRVTGLCEGNPLLTGRFSSQKASDTENVSIWWRHHVWFYSSSQQRSKATTNIEWHYKFIFC